MLTAAIGREVRRHLCGSVDIDLIERRIEEKLQAVGVHSYNDRVRYDGSIPVYVDPDAKPLFMRPAA
jgi:hypothetical protein